MTLVQSGDIDLVHEKVLFLLVYLLGSQKDHEKDRNVPFMSWQKDWQKDTVNAAIDGTEMNGAKGTDDASNPDNSEESSGESMTLQRSSTEIGRSVSAIRQRWS